MTPARPLLARAWSLACHSAKDRVLEVPGSKDMSLNVLCQKIIVRATTSDRHAPPCQSAPEPKWRHFGPEFRIWANKKRVESVEDALYVLNGVCAPLVAVDDGFGC